MKCPVCNSESRVVRTLKLDNPNKAIRNRVCIKCGYSFTTQEIISIESLPKENSQVKTAF